MKKKVSKIINSFSLFSSRRSIKSFSDKIFRSSRLDVLSYKKGVLKKFLKFTGKHMYQSLFLNKVAGLRSATLLKKRLRHWCFPVNFAKFLRTHFYRTPPVAASVFSSRRPVKSFSAKIL